MSDWPPVWLLFATHKRTETALYTIESLKKYLDYPNLHWHICDDGSRETDDGTGRWHVGVLAEAIGGDVTWHEMKTAPKTFNTGGNINKGMVTAREAGCSIHMLVFDDWALLREIDIRPAVDVLDTHAEVGFIRLSFLVPGLGSLCMSYRCPRLGNQNHIWLRLIREWSLHNPWKQAGYLVSTQPYIAHLRFFQAYGWHPENVNPGVAETRLGEQYIRSPHGENGPQILHHIGEEIVHAPWGHMSGRMNDYREMAGP